MAAAPCRPEPVGQVARLEAGQTDRRVDDLLDDLLGVAGGDLLDLHAAFGRRHHHHAAEAAVDHHAEVELARDVDRLLDEQPLDDLAARPGLVRDQVHAEDLLRGLARGGGPLDHLHAAPLAAPAGVDLRLDDHELVVGLGDQRLRGRLGLVDAEHRPTLGDRHAELLQDLFRLVLVDLHGVTGPFFISLRDYSLREASSTSRTAAADLSSAAFSSAASSSATIFSTPPAPITMGTPT